MAKKIIQFKLPAILLILAGASGAAVSAQSFKPSFEHRVKYESARSDKFTGGRILKTALVPGDNDIKITINVPAFQMTLWQNGREVKTYWIGVGKKDYPIFIGSRQASAVIWNPSWIPPDSDWVGNKKGVKAGEIIEPTDPRNPLGKLKIPLGNGYLIHQAQGVTDLGGLVSHGCVRVLKADLYDLAEKIAAARSLPVSSKQIAEAKTNLKTLSVDLDPPIPVEITYDTQVVEGGKLRVYPDVYERQTNTVEKLRDELESSGVETSHLSDATLEKILSQTEAKKQFVVSIKDIEAGKTLTAGFTMPVVMRAAETKPVPKKTPARKPVRKRRASR
jgi:lipoprotein-anchoring transpeptidase ErfK/SrfK